MNRFAAMQDCPLLRVRDVTAIATAAGLCALGMTVKGFDPPSFNTAFLMLPPAAAATQRPVAAEPASVTARRAPIQ